MHETGTTHLSQIAARHIAVCQISQIDRVLAGSESKHALPGVSCGPGSPGSFSIMYLLRGITPPIRTSTKSQFVS
jgi:hypothetical protein